ncbi:uncharacterized protein EMH_0022440 [Eimeria mitis]|uniref:Uncharacterized protein n=1 Tax=Eimeria mitis TaxID=44415 RepID=U6KA89_9EIME|nr:uncharacterized protein EMH_0022440 [Eimeria mitis]CDJ34849.1 hypothetical protein EMH_0022440 [Eimeria mitis]
MCSQSRMRNHAMRTRARQLSAGKGTKRGFESLCGSDSDEESAWLSSDSDHDASALLVLPIKARLMGKDLHESSGSLEAGQQAVSHQMTPSASALSGKTRRAYWKTDLSDPAGRVVSGSRKEVEATEALLQLSMSSSVELAGGGARGQGEEEPQPSTSTRSRRRAHRAREQGEEEPQPSTSTRSRRRAHRLRKPLSVAERAEAEVPAAPALGNLAYWKIALSDPAGGFVSDSRKEVEAAEALQQLSMGSSVGRAGGGAREQGEEEPQPSTSTRSRRRAHRLQKPLSMAKRAEAEVPAAPALGNLAYWKIDLSDPAGGFVSDSRKEVEAAEALQQLSMGSSVGRAGGGAREQGEEEPQPSTSTRSRRRAHRLQKPLSVAERAEAEVPAAPALGNLPISSHLFVRLPVVDKTKLLRRFSPTTAVCEGWRTAKPTVLLSRAHDYLAQPSLTPEEMEKLTYDAERLCKYLAHNKPRRWGPRAR